MSEDRDKLLQVMNSLENDYKSGKISAEKYRYFRSKYEDKLNSIDAMEATKRIRSMQGKSTTKTKKRSKKPTNNKKKQEQDLVQKYIINPKRDDAKYNKKKKSSMSSGTFTAITLLVLVIAFSAGVAYGIFNLDSESVANSGVVAIVEDTAFPETIRLKLQPQLRLRPQLQPLMIRQIAPNPVPVRQVIVVATLQAVIPQVRQIVVVILQAVILQVLARDHLINEYR